MNRHLGIGMTSQRTRDRLISRLREEGIYNPAVLQVMRDTPRHIFVDEALASRAYEDTALPIGYGQTISQPYMVALMTEALLRDGIPGKVLEIGTGSGYQTAVLAHLVDMVYSVERIAPLIRLARLRLQQINLRNVRLKTSDGNWGWPAYGPYDGIVVTAAPEILPQALLEQLSVGGRLVIPVGVKGGRQLLKLITRTQEEYIEEEMGDVNFVPLIKGGV